MNSRTFSGEKMRRTEQHMLLTLLITAGLGAGCGNPPRKNIDNPANAPSAAVVKVMRRDLASNLEIASEFQPFQEIQVYAKVSGYIQESYMDWGMHVKQGQLWRYSKFPNFKNSFNKTKQPSGAASKDWKALVRNSNAPNPSTTLRTSRIRGTPMFRKLAPT